MGDIQEKQKEGGYRDAIDCQEQNATIFIALVKGGCQFCFLIAVSFDLVLTK